MFHRSIAVISLLATSLLASTASAATGGPDAFGYTFVDDDEAGGPAYTWHTVTTSVGSASGCDDCSSSVALPFPFDFYGSSHSSLYVGSNGFVTFDSGDSDWTNSALSSSDADHVAIHAWWDDWDPRPSGSTVTYGTVGTAPNRVFVISWNGVRHYRYLFNADGVSFQIHLSEGSTAIELHYQDTDASGTGYDHGASGTVGIDNGTGAYLQYSHNTQSLEAGRAIRFLANQAPTAVAGGPYSGDEGSPIAVDASGSTDSDGTIVSYEWDCDDDGTYELSLSTPVGATCTWDDDGAQTVGLRVTDDEGATDIDTATVNVANVAPTITSVSTPNGYEGSPVSFSASITDPGILDTHTYAWLFGDGGSATAASASHTFADDGTYSVTLTVTDDDGGVATWSGSVVVENVAPTITSITIPSTGVEGGAVSLLAAATDVSADPLTFTWDFGDSSTGTGASISHAWIEDGTYTVTVTVSDGDGGSDVATGTITIANVGPTITSATFGSGDEGDAIPFSVAWTDAGILDTHTVAWDFGDSGSGSGASPTHVYADDGAYTVTVTVTDDDGGSVSTSGTATVGNVAPVLAASTIPDGDEGELLTFTVAWTDAGAADTHTVTWDFGDAGSGTGASATHAYADDGAYTVTATITDDDGGSVTVTDTADIANVDPVIVTIAGPTTGAEEEELTWTVTATDAGAADTHTYSFDFGDGSPAVTGADVEASHAYEDDGTYVLIVTVTDDDGGSTTDTLVITIENGPPTIDTMTVPAFADEGSPVAMSATATDAPSDTLVYDWDFGDSDTDTGDSVSHTYADDGVYTVTLTVSDDDGGIDTQTATITINNVVPSIDSMSVPGGDEGQDLLLSATASDPGADTLIYDWDFGDSNTGTGDFLTHAWADDGTYTVTLTVTDDDGGSVSQTGTAVIGNLPPSITSLVGPVTGDEGDTLTFEAVATDPGADTFTWEWDFGDGTPVVTGADIESHLFADDDVFGVTVTVIDDDGASASAMMLVSIANVDPVIDDLTAGDGEEGESLLFEAMALDPGDDTLVYTWDFGAGSPSATGMVQNHAYEDDGVYTITLTVTEEDGGSVTGTTTSTVTNVAPELTSLFGPLTGDEGSPLTFEASATDVGVADLPDLAYTWDFGGDGIGADSPVDHPFSDEGTYTVTVVVDDGDGGTDTDSLTVDIANVAPEITSSAPGYASEAVLWSYQAVAVDPGDDLLTWSLSESAPDGMVLDPATGLVEWTPTYAQSLGGPYSATLTVDDGDGGTDMEVFTVIVGWADEDGDGMADDWELDNGLDPTDPSDAAGDPDMDGVTNLDEFLDGTDPNSFDGPTAPLLVSPIEGDEVDSPTPDLVVENAFDPQLDPLTYDFEVYEDEAMTLLVTFAGGTVPETTDETTWKVDLPLVENGEYWWRAAASDGFAWGPWTDVESFIVNEWGEPPPVPVPLYPVGGETVATSDVELVWIGLDDPEGDALTFDVVLWDGLMENVLSEAFDLSFEESRDVDGAWLVDVTLEEDAWYAWEVRAVDEHGLEGDWSTPEDFFYDTSNAAPEGVFFIDPLDGDVLASLSPELVASEGVDPEEGALTYRFEMDLAETFDSGELLIENLPGTGTGEVTWDLLADGIELSEDTLVWARVRAIDEGGVGSAWDVISFFVTGDNTAPDMPALLVPEDGAETGMVVPTLVVGNVLDPEGDLVFYDFVLARDLEMTDVVTARDGVLAGSGSEGDQDQTSWTVDLNLEGDYYWTARAVDVLGAASDWAFPFALHVATGLGDDDDASDDDDDVLLSGGGGCYCESSLGGVSTGAPMVALLALVGVVGLRWRRATSIE